jgi:hypothetical protein
MTYATLPEKEAVLLVRALGLLVGQAGVYGSQHNVTQSSARCVFEELQQSLKACSPIEISTRDGQLLLNGSNEGISASAGKNLFDRMTLYKVGGLLFTAPLELREFLVCVSLFGTPPSTLAAEGGFEAVLKRAGLLSIRVVSVAYQRVEGKLPPATIPGKPQAPVFNAVPAVPRAAEPERSARPAMLDLSAAFAGAAPLGADPEPELPESPAESPAAASRRQRAALLAALMRKAAEALEQGADASDQEISGALDQIRETLTDMDAGSRRSITTLATQVDEDSKTIASIESAARRRGIGLKLTRGELVQRYAELNQEIVQPLTVSSGVIDLLHSGQAGILTESQHELLQLAAESVERVNQLVSYMNRISGLPESFTPDSNVIADSYR